MAYIESGLHLRVVAAQVANRLSKVADQLEQAGSPEEFATAIAENQGLWLSLRHSSPHLARRLPERMLRAALSLSDPGLPRLDDHKIELLIGIDRQASAFIADSASP